MRPADNINKLIKKLHITASAELDKKIHDEISKALEVSEKTQLAVPQLNLWRIIMKNRITKLVAAAVIIIGMFFLGRMVSNVPVASAVEILAQAVAAMPELKSVYIKAQMRTNTEEDHFDSIAMDKELVPVEMWKVFDGGSGKWRIENPGKIVVMDGKSSLLFFPKANRATKKDVPGAGFAGWLECLLNVDRVVKLALLSAVREAADFQLTHEIGEDGREKLIVIVEIKAKGDFTTSDYLRNTYLEVSDTRRIYRFDSATKLMEGLKIYVYLQGEDVLVFDIAEIQYNPEIDPKLFTLDLPENVHWWGLSLKENWVYDEKYAKLTPKEMAIAFFQACSDENWEEYLEFNSEIAVDQFTKDYLGGLKIISVGEPFKSGLYQGWFVPYEIQLKDGTIKKHNLAVRNDNPAQRYIVDGGI